MKQKKIVFTNDMEKRKRPIPEEHVEIELTSGESSGDESQHPPFRSRTPSPMNVRILPNVVQSEAEDEVDREMSPEESVTEQTSKVSDKENSQNIDQSEPNLPENALISQVELIWTTSILMKVLLIFKLAVKKSMKLRDLQSKRLFSTAMTLWNQMLDVAMRSRELKTRLKKCSWTDFESAIQGEKSYTMFCSLNLTKKMMDIFIACAEKATKEQSSLSPHMETTTTASTTATMAAPIADVPYQPNCEEEKDVIEDLLGLSSLPQSTGLISQSICLAKGEESITLKSPGEPGWQVIKMELYPFNEVCQLDKNQWWRHALKRSTFLISSNADPKHILVNKIFNQATKDILKIPGADKKIKPRGSTNTFYGYQQRR